MWNGRFPLNFRWSRREPNSHADGEDPVAPGEARLVREAFPRPEASGALRGRVAAICREAARTTAQPAAVRWHPAAGYGFGAAVVFLVVLGVALWPAGRRNAAHAYAGPTPGQLTLLAPDGRPEGLCPLRRTDVEADIAGFVARVRVTQEFRNPAAAPVEAVYTFPLPEDAAVDEMTMTIGDRVIRGQIKRRAEARALYEAARDAGQAAALLDQERPNIFTQSVANLMPGAPVRISISYVHLLKYDGGEYEWVFPMVVGPRYIPGGDAVPREPGPPGPEQPARGDGPASTRPQAVVTDADRITPPNTPPATRAGHDISLTVNLDAGVPVRGVESVLHPVIVGEAGPGRRTIRLRDQETRPNRDFILRYTTAGEQLQTALLASGDGTGGGHFTLILQPPATAAEEAAREIIFVIDQSGSQSGWPIRKAKETMRYLIHRMNPDDTFQLLGFNLAVNACFAAPVHNTPENVAKALRFLQPLEGEGGTDILQALDHALEQPDSRGRRRLICYLTDGYVGDDMQILAYLRKHRRRAHVFPFGIGNSVNRFVINGMAREGRGVAEYVTLNGSAEEAAARFYRRVAKPLLVEIGADWNGLPVEETYPRAMPDLFLAGQPVILKGRYTHAAAGELTLRGALAGQPWSQTIRINFPAAPQPGSPLATLWAREKIEDLQSRDWLGEQWGRPNPAIEREIVATALQYRLMSQHTSFVAVEERVVNLGGRQRRVEVPVEMPEGVAYDGIFGSEGQSGAELALERARSGAGVRLPESGRAASAIAESRQVVGVAGQNAFGYNPELRRLAGVAGQDAVGNTATGGGAQSTGPFPGAGGSVNNGREAGVNDDSGRAAAAAPASLTLPPPASAADGRRSLGAPASLPPAHAAPAFVDGQAKFERPQAAKMGVGAAAAPVAGAPAAAPPASASAIPVPPGPMDGRRERAPGLLARLSPPLRQLVERQRRPGVSPAESAAPAVRDGRVAVQLWVKELPPDGLKRLQGLGFELAATLIPGRLVLGTLPVDRLEPAAALDFVRRIEPPRYLDEPDDH